MKSKRFISILLIPLLVLSITLSDVKRVNAVGLDTFLQILAGVVIAAEQSDSYSNFYTETLQPKYIDMVNEIFERTGLVKMGFNENFTDTIFHTIGGDPIQNFRQYMAQKNNVDPSTITDDQAKEGLYNLFNNSHVDGSNVVIADDLKQYFFYLQDQYINSNKMYQGFSVDLQYYSNIWNLQNVVEQYQDDYYCFMAFGGNPISAGLLVCIPQGKESFVYSSSVGTEKYKVSIYDTLTFNSPNMSDVKVFDLKSTGPVQISVQWSQISSKNFYCANRNFDYRSTEFPIYYQSYQNDLNFVSYGKKFAIDIFGNYSMFTSQEHGQKPYYINNSVYNDWRSSTGDYTVTTDNSNHATYGDITNYIGNEYNDTGKYPTPEDINIYIEIISDEKKPIITPTPAPDPGGNGSSSGGSGGSATATANNQGVNVTIHNDHTINFPGWFGSGTVSGNTVSGNGVNGSGGGLNFGFLGTLGQTLKSLIENIGTAIVDIITGISSVIAEVVTNIPTVFGDFVGAVLGWLPPELQALISMAVVAMITYGLIKLIRG